MRYVIIGAGAIGATLGGRLAAAGHEVLLAARGEHARVLRERGLTLTTADGVAVHRLPVVAGPQEAGELRPDDVLVLAVKTQDAPAALDAWGAAEVAGGGTAAQRLPVLCAQNGVEADRMALRRFARVIGVCVWLPSTFLEPGEVSALCAPLTGILHLGLAAGGTDRTCERIAADLRGAGFGAPVVPDVMRWKHAKLLSNLGNAVQAVTGLAPDPAKGALALRAIREAKTVYEAAGIVWADEAEQAAARDGKVEPPAEGAAGRGGSTWQSLRRGTGSVEADWLNGEIALLGRLHGVPTPVNETLRHAANILAREGFPPGAMSIADLTALADEAEARGR
ncbi:ketopantoate reductase family protein [Streptomyces sp. BI20]|uniref:ketopantoate reductase family protein n=1 Tax=Streptomyces sp. BI20 TaxID=3403460 RepID=UPI003C75AC58